MRLRFVPSRWLFFCVLLTGCPLPERTIFYEVQGSVFKADDIPQYRINISEIIIAWHPQSAVEALAHHSEYKTEVIWKASALRPVQLAGLTFELFKAPPGFSVDVDRTRNLPNFGSFSLEVYTGSDRERKNLVAHEISPKAIAQIKSP
jgi:hypothetical protein